MTTIEQLYTLYRQHPVCTTDTRECTPGSIFFALRGETFNGNDFALQALQHGCAYAVVDDATLPDDPRLLQVDHVLEALQQLAAHHRRVWGGRVVQITGTNGKTTTKELTAAVLATRYEVLYTQGNLNNHIGVPKTLLRLTEQHQLAVVETGANHPGEIALLSGIVQADCGLITNVGTAHLQGFGSLEGVLRTKTELYDNLRTRRGGFIFLDAGNERLACRAVGLPAVTYGAPGMGCQVEGELLPQTSPFMSLRFRLRGGEWQEVHTHLTGSYNLQNVLAAVAVGLHFGVSVEQAARAVASYQPTNNRSQWMRTERNELIVDAYNANPTSMKAALDNMALMQHAHKMLILGEMRELGEASAEEHRRVAAQAQQLGCDAVWLVGEAFRPYADGAQWFADEEAVEAVLAESKPQGKLILVKGSNGTRLFKLPSLL